MKKFTLMSNISFHYLHVPNIWNIPSRHKKLLGPWYNCDAEDHVAPNCPLICNEENIKMAKELHEAYRGGGSGHVKGIQRKNDRENWNHEKEKSNGEDIKINTVITVETVFKRGKISGCATSSAINIDRIIPTHQGPCLVAD